MANHKSAIKRNRQNIKRREQNSMVKASVRTAIKKVHSAVSAGEKETAAKELHAAEKLIQKAAGHGLYHKNNAGRKVSRLSTAVAKIS